VSRYDELRRRLLAVELLRRLKAKYSYRRLSQVTGIPSSMLCRYVKGQSVPSLEQAEAIIRYLGGMVDDLIPPARVLNKYMLASDLLLLELLVLKTRIELRGVRVDKVLAREGLALSAASLAAHELGAEMVIAALEPCTSLRDCLTEAVLFTPLDRKTLYIPKNVIRRDDNVLIVDVFFENPSLLAALCRLVTRSGGKVVGAAAVMSLGDRSEYERIVSRLILLG